MRKVSEYVGKRVYAPKKGKPGQYERLGKVHMAVFSPEGTKVVGFMVARPDIAGMVKRPDVFVALDALAPVDGGWRLSRPEGTDDQARERLGIAWDACIMWVGMDAKTTKGKDLGIVADAAFDEVSGDVDLFHVSDGNVAESLVGALGVPVSLLVGYERGCMVVKPEAAKQALTGGVAAKAGEGYARAKIEGAKVAEKAGVAVDQGSRALGKQLKKTKGMFGSFVDEFKKASQ